MARSVPNASLYVVYEAVMVTWKQNTRRNPNTSLITFHQTQFCACHLLVCVDGYINTVLCFFYGSLVQQCLLCMHLNKIRSYQIGRVAAWIAPATPAVSHTPHSYYLVAMVTIMAFCFMTVVSPTPGWDPYTCMLPPLLSVCCPFYFFIKSNKSVTRGTRVVNEQVGGVRTLALGQVDCGPQIQNRLAGGQTHTCSIYRHWHSK